MLHLPKQLGQCGFNDQSFQTVRSNVWLFYKARLFDDLKLIYLLKIQNVNINF